MDRKSRAALLSVISNSGLVALKLGVGLVTGSVGVLSEAIHSGIDLLAAAMAFFAVRAASKPADEDHPFGHGKYENLSGMVEAALIFVAALMIAFEALDHIRHGSPTPEVGWGL
ncbi:MAG TPA: cation diffusion facilitator family transporter, partial [Stenomitos sp.]